ETVLCSSVILSSSWLHLCVLQRCVRVLHPFRAYPYPSARPFARVGRFRLTDFSQLPKECPKSTRGDLLFRNSELGRTIQQGKKSSRSNKLGISTSSESNG